MKLTLVRSEARGSLMVPYSHTSANIGINKLGVVGQNPQILGWGIVGSP